MTTVSGAGIGRVRHAGKCHAGAQSRTTLRHHAIARALIMALAATASLLLTPAVMAQQTPPEATRAAQVHSYHIATSPLGKALDALGAQSNIQIIYAPQLVAGKTSHGLSGSHTPTQALRLLLKGTHLTWTAISPNTFVLKSGPGDHPPAQLPADMHKESTRDPVQLTPMKTQALNPVTVSGSLINNAKIQTATPTFTITSQQIEALGFDSVAETLRNSVLSTGAVQGEASSGSFTQGAQTFSLNQLPPGFTLILVDGKPLAPFGELYNGTSTFHNVSNLPSSMIDHIDIMPGGASSIYGSSAMAGVVNIVTKDHMNGAELSGEVKGYARGGRAERKLTFAFGHSFGRLSVLGSFHYSNRNPLWAYQRKLTRSSAGNPIPPSVPTAIAEIMDYGTSGKHNLGYISPPVGCTALQTMYGGSVLESANPGHPNRTGTYCGTYFEKSYRTLSSKTRHYDGMLKLRYNLNSYTRLYADFMANYERKRYLSSMPHWNTDHFPGAIHDKIEDAASGEIVRLYRRFSPEEMPGGAFGPAHAYSQNNFVTNFSVGANGAFGADSDWQWNAYFQHAGDRSRYNKPLWLAATVNDFFQSKVLGPQVGTDPHNNYPLYNINYAAFFEPLTPDETKSLIYNNHQYAKSWVNNTSMVVNNPYWFALPGGHAGLAVLAQFGGQAWYEPVDPNMANGLVWGHAATAGGGDRLHQAVAFEFNLPLLKWMTVDLSGREDRYKIKQAGAKKKFTWKAGIELRPFETLLFRANVATSFKAPDMAGVFLGPSTSFGNEYDYYQCDLAEAAGTATNCDGFEVNIIKTHKGNPKLKPTTATSWTTGIVWAPSSNLSFNVDYLHTAIDNQTVLQSVRDLLLHEARCRTGTMDPNLPDCQEALTQVERDPTGFITGVTAYYANLSKQTVNSISASAYYKLHTDALGSFHFRLGYNNILKHTHQNRPGSKVRDDIGDPEEVHGFKSTARGSVSWHPNHQWHATLYWHRYGGIPNYAARDHGWDEDGAGRLGAFNTYNLSLSYKLTHNFRMSLHVNHLFNKLPPRDMTNDSYPYYATSYYSIHGRSISLNFHWKMGRDD